MARALGAPLAFCYAAACAAVAHPPEQPPAGRPGTPTSATSGTYQCREEPCGDRRDPSRELGPLSNSAPPVTGLATESGVAASNRGARGSVQRSAPRTPGPRIAAFEDWPAGRSPQEIGARVVRNYLARPLALG